MRVSLTKLLLAHTLYDMCERGRLEDITVTSLCEAADVTRPTFYSHFDDLDDAIAFASFLPATHAGDASDFGQVMRETCEGCLAHRGFFAQLSDVGRFNRQWSNGFGWLERAARRRAESEGLAGEEVRRMLLDCQLADQAGRPVHRLPGALVVDGRHGRPRGRDGAAVRGPSTRDARGVRRDERRVRLGAGKAPLGYLDAVDAELHVRDELVGRATA